MHDMKNVNQNFMSWIHDVSISKILTTAPKPLILC